MRVDPLFGAIKRRMKRMFARIANNVKNYIKRISCYFINKCAPPAIKTFIFLRQRLGNKGVQHFG